MQKTYHGFSKASFSLLHEKQKGKKSRAELKSKLADHCGTAGSTAEMLTTAVAMGVMESDTF